MKQSIEYKISQLVKESYFKIDEEFIRKYIQNTHSDSQKSETILEKFLLKDFILAREIGDITIFYSREYIMGNSLEFLQKKKISFEKSLNSGD